MIINHQNYMRLMDAKFKLGGRGPIEYDCYGLLMDLYAMDGYTLPEINTPDSKVGIDITMGMSLEKYWEPCEDEPGALVHIKVPKVFSHVGMSFGTGLFVHIWEGSGSVEVQSIHDWQHRIKGYYRFVGGV